MKHYNINELNKHQQISKVKTIITFRNEALLDLWEDEMSGQISDGMWENSNHTEWLWRDVWVRLGEETSVVVDSTWHIGRKSFGMTKDLWECIGDRLYGEDSPFKTEKDVRAAWREIANAIYNAHVMGKEDRDWIEQDNRNVIHLKAETKKRMWEEGKQVFEVRPCGPDSSYLAGISLKDPETDRYLGLLNGSICFLDNGKGYWTISINGCSWKVGEGHLVEAVDKIKTTMVEMAKLWTPEMWR